MKKVVVLLFIIFSISLLAQELNELSIVGKAVKTNDIVSSSIKDVNNRKASCIIFLTDLDVDMDFKPNIELVKLISKAGRHEVYVQPGERVIEVLASGFKPLNLVLSSYGIPKLESGDVYQLEITGEKHLIEIPITILVNPEGSNIFIDNEDMGQNETFKVLAGKHNIKIVKENYVTFNQEIVVSSDNVLFKIDLQELEDALVIIKTNPDSATVYLDDIKIGITPFSKFYKPGNYNLRIEKTLCEPYNTNLEIVTPKTEKMYNLIESYSTLTIKTYSGAKVFLNDKLITRLENIKLEPMLVNLKVIMPKAQPVEKQIILKKNEKQTIELYPEIATGTIQIAVTPFDSKIVLLDDESNIYNSIGGKSFKNIPVGNYDLKVTKNNYKTYEEKIRLKENEKINKEVILEKAPEKDIVSKYSNDDKESPQKRKLRFRISSSLSSSILKTDIDSEIDSLRGFHFPFLPNENIGFNLGFFLEYELNKNIIVYSGLEYQNRGAYIFLSTANDFNDFSDLNSTNQVYYSDLQFYNYQYISIPLAFKFVINHFYIYTGGSIAFLTNYDGYREWELDNYHFGPEDFKDEDWVNNKNFGLDFGIGFFIKNITINSQIHIGLTDMFKRDEEMFSHLPFEVSDVIAKYRMLSVGLSYSF